MSHVKTAPAKGGVGALSLNAAGEMGLDEELLGLPELGLFGDDISVEDLNLDDVGLGAVRHRRRRLSSKTRRKLARLARSRHRNKKGRFAGLSTGGKKHRRKKKATMGSLSGHRRRRRKARLSGKLRRKLSRLAKGRKRTKKGRFAGLAGTELLSLSGDDPMMDLMALSQAEGLGAVKHKRRRRRKHAMAGVSRKRRRGGRRRRHGMAGLGRLANIADGLGEVEVAASMPVLGVFQWLATGPGLEALGGVALAPLVNAIVNKGLSAVGMTAGVMSSAAGALVSAIAMWEFGRLVGSANIAKFGAFYSIGRAIEGMVTKPYIVEKIDMLKGSLGTYRESDTALLGGFGKIVLPDTSTIGDTQRVPDTSSIGQVLFPGIKRADYAVNPLSGFGTVREADTASIGDDDVEGLGVPVIPDTEMEGVEGSDLF